MAKSLDKRRKTPAQKARTAAARLARSQARRRVLHWEAAARAAEAAGYPLNATLTVAWSPLRGGPIVGLPAVAREKRLWADLQQVAARAGVPWLAARGPEYDRTRGLHLHIVLHLPDARALRDAIASVERRTGAPAAWCDMRGRTLRGGGRVTHGIVAKAAHGGWLLQRHVDAAGGTGVDLARYAAKGDGKATVEGQHRLSNALSALVRHWE